MLFIQAKYGKLPATSRTQHDSDDEDVDDEPHDDLDSTWTSINARINN